MALSLTLPGAGGALRAYALRGTRAARAAGRRRASTASPIRRRTWSPTRCAAVDPWLQAAVDWDATIAYRQRLWSLGLGVAEAMDTAQRGMGLDWPTSLELIRRSLDAARDVPGALVASGCGTDQLRARRGEERRRRDPRLRGADGRDRGARRQADRDGEPRAGARGERPGRLRARLRPHAGQARQPVILHWLGDMFDPALAGYWGTQRRRRSDGHRARRHRRPCRQGRRHQDLAARQGQGDRDAPPPAAGRAHVHRRRLQLRRADRRRRRRRASPTIAAATRCWASSTPSRRPRAPRCGELADGKSSEFHAILAPTVPLSRHIFARRRASTRPAWCSWPGSTATRTHFTMVGGQQSTRSLQHFAELFRLADAAGLLEQPNWRCGA